MQLAACVPEYSEFWKPARFVSLQSLAAKGNLVAAELGLEGLILLDHQYEILARENPPLRDFFRARP